MADTVVVDGSEGEVVVGGRVVEQTTAGDTHDDDGRGDEIAAAKAAVKKALAEEAEREGKAAAKEAKQAREKDPLVPRDRGPDGKFLPNEAEIEAEAAKKPAPPAKKDEEDEDASALRKALTGRREQAKAQQQAKAEIEQMREETRQFYRQLQAEKQQLAQEKARIEMLKKDPIRAIRENGWDPEEFIFDIASDGTPEGQARRQQRELQQQIAELKEWKRQQAEAVESRQKEQAELQKRSFRQNVEREFLNTAFNESAHPHLSSFYKGHEVGLIAEADVVAEQYRNVTGQEATFKEIAEYLEERAAKWYKSMSGAKDMPPVTQGSPTQGSATGAGKLPAKSLSPNGSGERRALGNSFADLDGEDRLEAAKTAVRAAIRASSER